MIKMTVNEVQRQYHSARKKMAAIEDHRQTVIDRRISQVNVRLVVLRPTFGH